MDPQQAQPNASRDPAWKYCTKGVRPGTVICNFCAVVTSGGIYRAKQHIVGGFRNSKGCTKVPAHVREEIREYMINKEKQKRDNEVLPDDGGRGMLGEFEEEDVQVIGSTSNSNANKLPQQSKKQKGIKGPLDMFFTPPKEEIVRNRRSKTMQTTMNDICKKELREKACKELANWFYDAGLPFNAANYDRFSIAMETVAQCGTCFKPPSYHEIRVPYLTKVVDSMEEMVKQVHHEQWAKYACSLMSDGWKDSVANRDIINFLVNSPKESVFVKSVDASDIVKCRTIIYYA